MAEAARDMFDHTIRDFDAFVENDRSGTEFELIDGQIVMMSNPTLAHEQIVSNIGAPLKIAMNKRACHTFFGGARVQAGDDPNARDKYRPDVIVHSGPRDDRKTYVTDPVVIVEALSPSTMDYDRGPKLEFYKRQLSIEHIVLAYSDQTRVEHYRRSGEDFERLVLTEPDNVLALGAVGFEVALEDIYFDIAFRGVRRP